MPAPNAATARQRVFVHVGPPKTGTTFVQGVLWNNRAALRDSGILVPGRGEASHFTAAGDLRGRVKRRGAGQRKLTGHWDRLAAEVREWPGTSVISCEWLAACDEQQVKRAITSFGPVEVHVVTTLRDLGRVVPAVWQEQIKNGKHFTMTEFLDQLAHPLPGTYGELFWRAQDTRRLLGRWGQDLPADRVHAVTLPASGADPAELWNRFSSLLVADPAAYDTSGVRANPGLDPAAAELLRRVNAELGGRMRKAAHSPLVKQLLHGELTKEKSGGRTRLPAGEVASIAATGEAVIEWLRESGHDVVGDLADLRVDTTPRDTSLPEDSPEADVSRAAVRSMASLLLTMQADGAHKRKVWRGGPRTARPEHPESDAPPLAAPPRAATAASRRALSFARRVADGVRRRVTRG